VGIWIPGDGFSVLVRSTVRRTALFTLRTLFGIPFGSGALSVVNPLMACSVSEGLVDFGSLAAT
jgi:hypothetical protein